MSIYAVADQTGAIINRIILDDPKEWSAPDGCVLVKENGSAFDIGGKFVDGVYSPPSNSGTKPAASIGSISDRQFFQQLAAQGIITQAEALAAVKTGTIPATLQAIVNALPIDQQFPAQMLLSGATVFERKHPLTSAVGAAYGWSSAQVDQFFIDAGSL